ncbi:MAG: hypothetical protein H5T86_16630 [Armatimonadetes bacterium]|nr:hypothetical protein [Armatimonadota bacterium]
MLADDLRHAAICQWNGVIYAAGWADGSIWFEYSDRPDLEKCAVTGSETRVKICDAEEQQPAIEMTARGELVVAVDNGNGTATFFSPDHGRTWLAV